MKPKPCPFCGFEEPWTAVSYSDKMYHSIMCPKCKAHSGPAESPEEALKLWNTRLGPDIQLLLAEMERLNEVVDGVHRIFKDCRKEET